MAKRYWTCVVALCLSAGAVLSYANSQIEKAGRDCLPVRVVASQDRPAIPSFGRTSHVQAFSIPLTFEPALTVTENGVQFVARGTGMDLALTRKGIELATPDSKDARAAIACVRFVAPGHSKRRTDFRWRGVDRLRGETNYLLGNDRAKWRTHVPHYLRAETNDGPIGITAYPRGQALEYDLRVPPNVDVSKIRVAISGAHQARLDRSGNLIVRVGAAELRMDRPAIYEEVAFSTARFDGSNLEAIEQEAMASSRSRRTRTRSSTRSRRRSASRRTRSRSGRRSASGRSRRHRSTSSRRSRSRRASGRRSSNRRGRTGAANERRIDGAYVLEADGTIGFRIARQDSRATLVIDPTISLAYSSFLGGAGADAANSIATDASGKIYIAGTTTSPTSFPEATTAQLGPGLPANPASGTTPHEFFVAKIDPTQTGANSLVYLTFLGGSTDQAGGVLAVDSAGDVAITGTTSSADFPVTDSSTRTAGANDTIVSEIDPTGSKLLYSTIFGGNGAESQQTTGGIALDSSGDIFVTSDTNSTNLPVTSGAYATAYTSPISDGFLAIFQPGATPGLTYCAYLGLNGQIGVGGIAVDASGNAYLAGFTSDPNMDFPSKNFVQAAFGGGAFDAFLMKIAPEGNGAADLIYATLLGGNNSDKAFAVALDSASPPNAYVTGTTSSTNFPTNGSVAAYQPTLPSNATSATSDAFLSVIAQNATTGQTSLVYSTYLGGSQTDTGYGIEAAQPYAVYVTGTASSWDFPWRDNFQPFNGYGNAFVAKLDTTTSGAAGLIYSTPLGGTSPAGVNAGTQGSAIAIVPADTAGCKPADSISDCVWVTGQTTSLDFPSAGNPGNGFQQICGSCQESPVAPDAFVAEIQQNATQQLPSLYFAGPGIPLNFGTQSIGATNIPPQFAAIKNGGEAILNISTVGLTGPNSDDFSLSDSSGCTSSGVVPGGMCSFEVSFVPSTAGAEQAFVQVQSNAPGNPQVLEVVATVLGLAATGPTTLDFGNQIAGTTSAPRSASFTNTSNQYLFIDAITESGTGAAAFPPANTSQQCVTAEMQPAAGCSVAMTFAPTTTGTFAATVTVQYHFSGTPEYTTTISLTGVGVAAAPVAAVAPTSLDFGALTTGQKSGAQVVTLTNKGSGPLDVTSIGVTGTSAGDFAIESEGATPCPTTSGTIAIGTSCTVGVQFAPQTAGSKSAALSFVDNASGSPQTVPLSGTAQSPSAVQVAPTTVTFASQSVGTKSSAQQVTVTNTGGTALSINGISLTGSNASDFSQTNNCPPSLAMSASCLVSIVFQPSATGTRKASLTIADDAAGSPQQVALTGSATQAGVTLSSASVNFGNQAVGTASSAVAVTVTNSGSGPLAISGISVSGTNASDFSETDNCTGASAPSGIAASGTCAVQIIFKPACGPVASALRSAAVSLADNAPGSPQSIALSGTGTGPFCFIVPSGDSTSASVSPGQTGSYALQVEAANAFTGNVSLACAGAPANATCTVTPTSVNIGGNQSPPLQVSVTTSAGTAATIYPNPEHANGATPERYPLLAFAVLALIAMVWQPRSRRERSALCRFRPSQHLRDHSRGLAALAAAVILLAFVLAACGGGGTTSTGTDPPTPAGTYTITISGTTAAGASQSIMLTLTVQ